MNTFYWDAAPGATSYRVSVDGGPSSTVDAPTTNLQLDLSNVGLNPQMSWKVEAIRNGEVICTSQIVSVPREWSPTPAPSGVAGTFSAWVSCLTTFVYQVNYSGLPAGTTSVTVNYTDTPPLSATPGAPQVASVPPDPGSVVITTLLTASISNVSITANPSGVTVNLPGPFFC
jgi:hypothetical protein